MSYAPTAPKDPRKNNLPRSMDGVRWIASSPMRIRRNARKITRSGYFFAGPKTKWCYAGGLGCAEHRRGPRFLSEAALRAKCP